MTKNKTSEKTRNYVFTTFMLISRIIKKNRSLGVVHYNKDNELTIK